MESEGLPEGSEGLPGGGGGQMDEQTNGQTDGQTDGISPHSTGLRPLLGPLPKNLKETPECYIFS